MAYFHLLIKMRERSQNRMTIYHPAPTLGDLLREIEHSGCNWLRATEHRPIRDKSGNTRWAHNETAIAIAEIVRINAIVAPAIETVTAPVEAVSDPEERAAA